jgi:hypothetical protein
MCVAVRKTQQHSNTPSKQVQGHSMSHMHAPLLATHNACEDKVQ